MSKVLDRALDTAVAALAEDHRQLREVEADNSALVNTRGDLPAEAATEYERRRKARGEWDGSGLKIFDGGAVEGLGAGYGAPDGPRPREEGGGAPTATGGLIECAWEKSGRAPPETPAFLPGPQFPFTSFADDNLEPCFGSRLPPFFGQPVG
jgi:hypothetical protein